MTSLLDAPAEPGMKERFLAFTRTERYRWVLVWFMLILLFSTRAAAPTERDPYWGAKAGWENLTGGAVAPLDTWSWTKPGEQWFPNSPAWNWVLGAGYHYLGFWGLYLVAMANMVLFFWLAWKVAVRLGARPLPGLAGIVIPLMLIQPMLSARATLFVQSLILVAVLVALEVGKMARTMKPYQSAPVVLGAATVLSVVGNWVHLSFLLFAWAVAGLWAVMWWFTPDLDTSSRIWMGVAGFVGAGIGIYASPYGWGLGMERTRAVQVACEGLITEWINVWTLGSPQWWLAGVLAVAFSGWATWVLIRWLRAGRRMEEKFRIVAALTAFGLPTALVGWTSVRFLGVSIIAMLPVFAWVGTLVSNEAHRRKRVAEPGSFWAKRRVIEFTSGPELVTLGSFVAVVLLFPALLMTAAGARPPEMDVIDKVPTGATVLAEPGIAGPMVLTRPDVKVSMDGRADFFGRDLIIKQVMWTAGMKPFPDQVTAVVLRTERNAANNAPLTKMATKMDTLPGWKKEASANGFTLWVRT